MSRGTERFENDARPFNSTLETVWNEFQMRDSYKAGQVLQEFMAESFELGEIVSGEEMHPQLSAGALRAVRAEWLKARDKFCQQMVDDAVDGEETLRWILDLC